MTAGRKWIVFVVLLVCLSFPCASQGLSFKLLGDDDDDSSKESIVIKKNYDLPEKKFKFHKLQKISIENFDEEEEDQDEEGNNNEGLDKSNINSNYEDDAESNEVGDHNPKEVKRKIRNNAQEDEFHFERVRRAQKSNPQLEHSETETTKRSIYRKLKDSNGESKETLSGLFQTVFSLAKGNLLQFITNDKTRNGGISSDQENHQNVASVEGNGIIDGLKWLGEKLGRTSSVSTAPSPTSISTDGWLSYLNRWPFNSLFPFEKTAKRRRPVKGGGDTAKVNCVPYPASEEPISQKHFESLLNTLPAFVINVSHIQNNPECKEQIQIFHRQLRGNKLWTLQMLDATAKIPSGLLHGAINQFGDFDLCMQTKRVVKVTPEESVRIRGKYCIAHVEIQTTVTDLKVPLHMVHGRTLWNGHLGNPSHFIPLYSIANWGVCIPHLCTAAVVKEMIESNLRPYNVSGLEFHVEVKDKDCYTRQSKRTFLKLVKNSENDLTIKVIVYVSALLLLLVITSLIADYWKEFGSKIQKYFITEEESEYPKDESSNLEEEIQDVSIKDMDSEETQSVMKLMLAFFKSFSPRRTCSELLKQDGNDVQFPIIHLLKLCASLMLYICLKYMMIGHLPITNRDTLVHFVRQPLSIVFRLPMLYSDVLLLVSGFIIAHQLSEEMEQNNYIHLLKRLAAKSIRHLPTVCLVLTFQTWLLPHLGSGPLWSNIIGQQSSLCEKQLWRNIFSVQNVIDVEETCSPMTIQVALEMQLYLLSPLLVWLYYTDSDAGFFAYGAIHAMSVAARFSRTNREQLSITLFHGMNISKFYRTANTLFASPISRATPYLLGIGAGILQRTQAGEFDLSGQLKSLGWLLSMASIGWCFWVPSNGMRTDFMYSATDAASYASWSSLLLGLGLVWIILMCPRNEQSLVHTICSSRPVLYLSRISFPMQLVTYVMVLYNTASTRDATKYNFNNLIDVYEIILIVIFGTTVAFLIDVPMQNIRRLCVYYIFKERSAQDTKHEEEEEELISGTEPSEAEASEERSENVACDTPEPPDTIWSISGEEEAGRNKEIIFKRNASEEEEMQVEEDEGAIENIEKLQSSIKAEEEEEEEEDKDKVEEEYDQVLDTRNKSESLYEKDIEKDSEVKITETSLKDVSGVEEEMEEEEEEEENDIGEDEEIKKRPTSRTSTTPPPTPRSDVINGAGSLKSISKQRRKTPSDESE